jgi:hypothetical protein
VSNLQTHVDTLPANTRASFREFASLLGGLAGENLLSLTAFGGWLFDDPFYAGTPARSVVVVAAVDLRTLDQLATQGTRFGRMGLAAPLVMTPSYIEASRDVFPLELLEIQQLHARISGDDHFQSVQLAPADLRLQCERELKSTLIQLRQGLLAVAGDHKQLAPLCRSAAERVNRVLRGLVQLAGQTPAQQSAELLDQAAAQTKTELPALRQVFTHPGDTDLQAFEHFYGEVAALAEHADQLAT